MLTSNKLLPNLWKLHKGIGLSSNIYLIPSIKTIIDLGSKANSIDLIKTLNLIGIPTEEIRQVIFTHLHHDHIGSPKVFKHAKFYASKDEIVSFKLAPLKTTLNENSSEDLKKVRLKELKDKIDFLEVIQTPGHTQGSVCLYWPEEKILFSGDTLYQSGRVGRTDLPNSKKERMKNSLEKLSRYDIKIICDGHE